MEAVAEEKAKLERMSAALALFYFSVASNAYPPNMLCHRTQSLFPPSPCFILFFCSMPDSHLSCPFRITSEKQEKKKDILDGNVRSEILEGKKRRGNYNNNAPF